MYGYTDTRVVKNVRLFMYLAATIAALFIFLFSQERIIQLSPESLVTLIAGLAATVVAIDVIFLQVRLNLKHKIETEAITAIQTALNSFASKGSITTSFSRPIFVSPLITPKPRYWFDKALKKHTEVANHSLNLRKAQVEIFIALESYEIAVIHLEQYYRFLTMSIDDLLKSIDECNSNFFGAVFDIHLTEEQYRKALEFYMPLENQWSDLMGYLMDFRKMLHNDLLGKIFGRRLKNRKPLPGFGLTLRTIATTERVNSLIKERDKELLN